MSQGLLSYANPGLMGAEKQRAVRVFPDLKTSLLTLLSPLLSFAPPVSDSPSFSSVKLQEWSAINRTNFPPASSPLVNGVDKPHLEPEAKYTQVKTKI